MLKSHERFHSVNGKRQILVADDEFINRELLRAVLKDSYELLFASNGKEALDLAHENKDTLSLILLDLMMPVMSGIEMLKLAKSDPSIAQIPIIVISADQDSEIECLTIGATDFIPKPYPQPGVIQARVLRTIELSEDRQIINSTERDNLTGLYNREYFYRYAEQYDQYHKNVDMDAIVIDVNHFHMINERFGTMYGDKVLRNIGEALRASVSDNGGIVCRREADTFMVYCPHGLDYEKLLDDTSVRLASENAEGNRVWLRMGVYACADKTLEIQRRFDRAKMAADTVQGSFTKRIGIYDSTLHEKELYSEQLIENFDAAIKEHQFSVFYQPKFDVQPEIPVLASAEALVRWKHPKLGMISPGVFIPLFETNGLIQRLDLYVWREAAAQIRDWKDRLGFSVPVSVNVSRIDMYDPHLVDTLLEILKENGLSTRDMLLEITESAYTQDSEQIVETVNRLRRLGFRIEMDDFGTGYSSLNMISTLPIDALKLDMQFIRSAFSGRKDTRMLEVIIDIADYLCVPVIAEGVETEDQLVALREMGCDFVQGYYFSRPVPNEEYEEFILERIRHGVDSFTSEVDVPREVSGHHESAFGEIAHALSSGFESIYYVDTDSDHYVEFTSRGKLENLQIENSGVNFFGDARQRILDLVAPQDLEYVRSYLQKEFLLEKLDGPEPFVIAYRVSSVDGSSLYSMKAVRANTHDDHHIVIGVSDIDEQVKGADTSVKMSDPDFGSIARTLSDNIDAIYYVDVNSGAYHEYRTGDSFVKIETQGDGEDFFSDCVHNIGLVVHPADRDMLLRALDKERLMAKLSRQPVVALSFRLLMDGGLVPYRIRIALVSESRGNHLIASVSKVEEERTGKSLLGTKQQNVVTYASIVQALATDYSRIYYVNTVSDEFVEYRPSAQHDGADIETGGEDFFKMMTDEVMKFVHPDDAGIVLSAYTKKNMLTALERERTFTLTYRLLIDDDPSYMQMKATRIDDRSDNHVVIGISNVDEQIKREQEHARALRIANQDSLTGVKSKHAYTREEHDIDQAIAKGTQKPFALVVCDLNDLKLINDTYGHAMGDKFIKSACTVVCDVFKHSPVYRIGGDEFVAILQGSDYEARDKLMELLEQHNDQCRDMGGGVSIAGGIAVYDPEEDTSLASVFARADSAMYDDKKRLKDLEGGKEDKR